MKIRLSFLLAVLFLSAHASDAVPEKREVIPGADAAAAPLAPAATKPRWPPPPPATLVNVAYGSHERQVLDFWKAESSTPTPVLFHIHGGAWNNGDKSIVENGEFSVKDYLSAGISVVSINYRYVRQAEELGLRPPVRGPLEDAARALQFVRHKAGDWNIDKQRIALVGGSAGGCSSLWLAFHADLADSSSPDPVARESTRPYCAAVVVAQTTLDPLQMKEWIPNSRYGAHAFGFKRDAARNLSNFDVFLAGREGILPWIAEYSPYALVSADDPPVLLFYRNIPAIGQDQKDPTHTANFGVKLEERCREVGARCELIHGGTPKPPDFDARRYIKNWLVEKLKAERL